MPSCLRCLYCTAKATLIRWSSGQVLLKCIFPSKQDWLICTAKVWGLQITHYSPLLQLFNNDDSYFYQSEKQWVQDLLPGLLRKHLSYRNTPSSNQHAKQPLRIWNFLFYYLILFINKISYSKILFLSSYAKSWNVGWDLPKAVHAVKLHFKKQDLGQKQF